MNIDIASCYNFVYKECNKEKISNLDRLSAMVYCSSLEDSIEYRFKLVEEDALERGIDQGKEETLTDTIKSMLKEKLSYDLISKITGKSLKEIKKIEESLKD